MESGAFQTLGEARLALAVSRTIAKGRVRRMEERALYYGMSDGLSPWRRDG
jgi:hypothetical protein